jgi:hypothetical protein
VASTVDLKVIGVVAPGSTDPLWAQSAGNWLKDMGVLIGLAVFFTLLTWLRVRRLGPRRRKGNGASQANAVSHAAGGSHRA